jgi:multicomponent K+:H+ antiporter subunit D
MSALPWMQHLIVVPVLLPLLVGALLIPVAQNRHGLKFAASAVSGVLLWLLSLALLQMADGGHWPAASAFIWPRTGRRPSASR